MTIADSLRTAKERNAVLNAADDRILQAITAVEEALRAHINIRVRIPIDEKKFLAFGKLGGVWRLLIEGPHEQQALSSYSREVRVQIFTERLVEKLIVDAREQMDKQIEERKLALDIAASIIDALGKGAAS